MLIEICTMPSLITGIRLHEAGQKRIKLFRILNHDLRPYRWYAAKKKNAQYRGNFLLSAD